MRPPAWWSLAVDEPEKVQIFGFTIIFPITFLGNAFIPVSDKYPSWIRAAVPLGPGG